MKDKVAARQRVTELNAPPAKAVGRSKGKAPIPRDAETLQAQLAEAKSRVLVGTLTSGYIEILQVHEHVYVLC